MKINKFSITVDEKNGKLLRKKDTNYKKLILHCSAFETDEENTPEYIEKYHQTNEKYKFITIGYQFFIDPKGQVWYCRPLKYISAHCKGHNTESIGICVGGLKFPDFEKTEQFKNLVSLCKKLMNEFNISKENIFPHNHFNKYKACPVFDVQKVIDKLD